MTHQEFIKEFEKKVTTIVAMQCHAICLMQEQEECARLIQEKFNLE